MRPGRPGSVAHPHVPTPIPTATSEHTIASGSLGASGPAGLRLRPLPRAGSEGRERTRSYERPAQLSVDVGELREPGRSIAARVPHHGEERLVHGQVAVA